VSSIFLAVAVPAAFAALCVLMVGYFSTSTRRDEILASGEVVQNA
jgi:hypothetical protein